MYAIRSYYDSQIKLYENHIAKMAELQPDALIVSSPGIVKMAKQIAPNIPIHLSTQANVMNALDAQVSCESQFDR